MGMATITTVAVGDKRTNMDTRTAMKTGIAKVSTRAENMILATSTLELYVKQRMVIADGWGRWRPFGTATETDTVADFVRGTTSPLTAGEIAATTSTDTDPGVEAIYANHFKKTRLSVRGLEEGHSAYQNVGRFKNISRTVYLFDHTLVLERLVTSTRCKQKAFALGKRVILRNYEQIDAVPVTLKLRMLSVEFFAGALIVLMPESISPSA
jgi:hypothetical protein